MPNTIKGESLRRRTQDAHIARIVEIEGEPFEDALKRRYLAERIPLRQLAPMWGLTFRTLRGLCERFELPVRSSSEAVSASWTDERRVTTAAKMRETVLALDMRGDRNPAKRPEVRAKISAARHLDNAMWRPEVRAKMAASARAFYAANPHRHINYRMAKSHRRSGIERMMQNALKRAGVRALHGQRIGRRWPDLIIPFARLVIECDGVYWHQNPTADAMRDNELREAGWEVLHFTDERIVPDADGCAADVITWLQARGFNPAAICQDGMLRRHKQLSLI